MLREKYFNAVGNLKKMYKDGRLVLTQKTLERAQVYLNEDKYFEALGYGRREISEKDQRRFNRMAVGAEIKHNERQKHMYDDHFAKNMDLRKGGVPGAQYQDPGKEMMIDDEYMDGLGKYAAVNQRSTMMTKEDDDFEYAGAKKGRVVGVRPGS